MAPSLLLQPDEDQPFVAPAVKQMPKSESVEGGVSLEVHAPTAQNLSVHSSSPSPINGAGDAGTANGTSGRNGPSSRQLDGEHFITSQTLLENARNFAANNAGTEAPKKPNILYIMADQMAAPLLKMNNPDSVIKTPNLDELAKTGVVFSSAYCNSPLCAPSRFTMCTGQLPSKIGGYDNASVLNSEVPTYAHYLRREGYETALAGKMHFIGKDQLHGFEHRYGSAIETADTRSLRLDSHPTYTLVISAGRSTGTNLRNDRSGTTTCPPLCKLVPVFDRTSWTTMRTSCTR